MELHKQRCISIKSFLIELSYNYRAMVDESFVTKIDRGSLARRSEQGEFLEGIKGSQRN